MPESWGDIVNDAAVNFYNATAPQWGFEMLPQGEEYEKAQEAQRQQAIEEVTQRPAGRALRAAGGLLETTGMFPEEFERQYAETAIQKYESSPFWYRAMIEGGGDLPAMMVGPKGLMRAAKAAGLKQKGQTSLRRAIKALRAGVDPDEVRQKYGWLRGPEGKMRFEISDADAKIKRFPKYMESMKLSDVLEHKKLYSAYPEFKEMPVVGAHISDELANYARNMLGNDPDSIGVISINPNFIGKNTKKSLFHEIQHAIQEKEGFSKGFNPKAVRSLPNYESLIQEELGAIGIDATSESAPKDLLRRAEIGVYMRYFGEIEARDTAERAAMGIPERRATKPYVGQGIPRRDWIIRRR